MILAPKYVKINISNFGGLCYGTYQRLWKTLEQKKIRKHDLMELAGISSTTLTKLNKNEIVALTVLVKICKALDCRIEDIMEITE